MNIPKTGDKIYTPTALHVYRGADDIQGGVATISNVEIKGHLPDDDYNKIFVNCEEIPGHSYNYKYLLENQEKWKKIYGNQPAKPDPDYRPEFNDDNADWIEV